MEYLLGSIITIVTLFIAYSVTRDSMPKQQTLIKYSQSYKIEGMKDLFLTMSKPKPVKNTQSRKYTKDNSIRVLFFYDKAYWITDNALYVADVVDGTVDNESAKTVDTMGMDKVQLDKTIYIVSKLTEGLEDDRGNTGNTKL